ncbi:MAG: hypothetical protein KIH63_004805 [Candidatus Saccharibacteria bacterium]|nr:hypothetical protein [Candidatus Saccharibacteria bacterium]
MKLSQLIFYAQGSLERWGDVDCYLECDQDGYIYLLEAVVGEINDDKSAHVVLSAHGFVPNLRLVK